MLLTSGCHCSTVSRSVTICLEFCLLLEKYFLKVTIEEILPVSLDNQETSFQLTDTCYVLF